MNPAGSHEGGLSVRDQIERYRTAFISVLTMFVIAVAVAGYVLAHENLHLPSWVPVLGHNYYTLKADFGTAQAVTPGQGQAVTIAGAKVGEIASVNLHAGIATVTMKISPKYAHFYKNATLLLRPKTQLQDITVEVNPGTASAGKLKSGEVLPQSQTAPNVDFDEFLAGLDKETRDYLQELLAGAAGGFKNNSTAFAAAIKRFAPTARYAQQIASQLEIRHANIARSIHNFRLLMEALGGKDKQLAQLVDASNAVFKTFAEEETNLQSTLHLLPSALHKTGVGLGKLAQASDQLGPALRELRPFARSLGPAQEATKKLARETKPVIETEVRPFAREILPTINKLAPSTEGLSEALPKLATSFGVLNEFFNELAYNPGKSQGGFLFFVPWANHNLNSVVSNSDANGPVGRSLLYFNCEILPIFTSVGEINPNVNLLIGLLKPPTKAECESQGITKAKAVRASARSNPVTSAHGILGGIATSPFASAASTGKAGGGGG
ncbi:MAG TPA: MlaD family protein [Solirubrobacteraceae bacterium]|jgi:phospholipid/cholesterol/gamma-HCH transport system substrate-binding protein|nr:MlaD family protein [Solirubrobacteraceae bacterium]